MITNLLVGLVGLFLFFVYAVPILIVYAIIIGLIFLIKAKGMSKTCKILIVIIIILVILIIYINIYHETFNGIYTKMNRINNNNSLIGLTKEEVIKLLGEPKSEFDNKKAKGYRYDAGYLTKEICLFGHTFWLKTYYYEFIVYFDETDKVNYTLRQETLRLGG